MSDEAARLAALRSYDILDTDTQASFADYVQIAAEVCGTPVALVSLVDEARQWFAAEIGLGVRETPLEASVCALAIQTPGPFVVPDLKADRRFDDNPLVSGGPLFRFYGSVPIESPEGFPLGTVCVLDDKPRSTGLTPRQLSTLQALARQVMTQLELRRALRDRTEALRDNRSLLSRVETACEEKDAALALKDALMLEAHHRVKNSLQTVQSLLILQAKAIDDEVASRQLRESAGRVRTFGALHEHLYRVGAGAEVDISSYLRSLLSEQEAAFAATLGSRAVLFEGSSLEWPSAKVPTVGLVLVELVTNAFKYGKGTTRVELSQSGSKITLSVRDDGNGMPEGFDPSHSGGFGMRIIAGLLLSQNGALSVDRAMPGTCFVATFSAPAR